MRWSIDLVVDVESWTTGTKRIKLESACGLIDVLPVACRLDGADYLQCRRLLQIQ